MFFVFFKQKTAFEMRISDWSSDVCSSDLTSVASIAHQVHGAIGFTYEHALHFATRRLWSWRAEFGAESHWAELLGRAAIRRGADRLWPDLTARDRKSVV